MLRKFLHFIFTAVLLLLVVNCAKKGTPTGGPKDETPPEFVEATPPNYSTNFEGDEIRIYFDEYVQLKDLQKNLIISPPMDPAPLITPLGSASRFIKIEILDTLLPETTYAFNFGESVVDFNEGNPFSFFKYVMSTGDYIDSLTVTGEIRDARQREPDKFVTVMLYEADSTYTDSLVYKKVPRYVTNTLDTTIFELSNLKSGRYRMLALKDEDNNYTFQPAKDKIAFLESFITIPTDSSYVLRLFKEEPDPKAGRPRMAGAQRVSFPYVGKADSIRIELLNEKPENFNAILTAKKEKDTLFYWYKPKIEADSLIFRTVSVGVIDTMYLRKLNLKKDSLIVRPRTKGTLVLEQPYELETTIPVTQIDEERIKIIKKDSSPVSFSSTLYPSRLQITLKFKTEENEAYNIQFLPGAITDFYGSTTDTLAFKATTREYYDYGDFDITLQDAENVPHIVQLVTKNEEVKREVYGEAGQTTFTFSIVEPGQYFCRIILDRNKNREYDSGDFLEQRQPEKIIYYPELLDLRSGFYEKKIFILDPPPAPATETDPGLQEN